jgi:hypothetical protein
MLALAEYRAARCGGCGGDLLETTSHENWDAVPPMRCHKCTDRDRSRNTTTGNSLPPCAGALRGGVSVARTVRVVIEASVAGAIANVKAFQGTVKDLGSELDRAAAKHPERLNKISNATGMLGIGMAVAFGAIVKSAMDFDRQMSHVVAVSDDGTQSLGAFRDAAIAAGRDTAFTATQAGQAEEELAKAGVSTADILHGALTGALNLAAAGTIDLADAATIAAQAMTEFGLSGRDVGHIADVLTAGANKSTADVSGLGMALGQVGGIAHQTGLSLEDTVGVLARFTQGGMAGEEAGTTLKQTLLQLQAPSKEAADLMKKLGINIYDANGQFIGITKRRGQLAVISRWPRPGAAQRRARHDLRIARNPRRDDPVPRGCRRHPGLDRQRQRLGCGAKHRQREAEQPVR